MIAVGWGVPHLPGFTSKIGFSKSTGLFQGGLPMSRYRRLFISGGQFFFTLVTEHRRPILTSDLARRCLRNAITSVQIQWPFEMTAIVLMPDHLHTIWTMPPGDSNYSLRIMRIKALFTREFLLHNGNEAVTILSKQRRGERGVWQRRFWEHAIRNEHDFENHYHYLHYNPVKHAYVKCVRDWPYSSFHRNMKRGLYPEKWGYMDYGKPSEVIDLDCE